MLELILERIATAVELIAGKAPGTSVVPKGIAAAVEKADAAEPAKKPRGRPAKITDKEKAGATDVEPESTDDFLDPKKDPVKEEKPFPRVEEVRGMLRTYAMKNNPATNTPYGMGPARDLLKKYGNGAVRLQEETKLGDEGKTGVLEPKYYQAVIDAASEGPVAAEEF